MFPGKPVFSCAILVLIAVVSPSHAAPPEVPQPELHLLDGGPTSDGRHLAGIRIRMEEGWKTYWRYPGDSGIPPSFDFSASQNVSSAEVLWPAPAAYHDGYGWVIGYEGEVVFPVLVTPQDPASEVALALDMDYAVCLDICIPVEGSAAVTLDGAADHAAEIEAYLARVPVRLAEGDARGNAVEVEQVGSGGDTLRIDVRMGGTDKPPLLLVEGPADWYLPLPEHVEALDGGMHRFRVPLDGVPDGAAVAGAELRLTAVSDGFAFEQTVTIE